jgi:hypothetical protein
MCVCVLPTTPGFYFLSPVGKSGQLRGTSVLDKIPASGDIAADIRFISGRCRDTYIR